MRHPDLVVLEFRTAVGDQRFQRVGGGLHAQRFHLVARRAGESGIVLFLGGEAVLLRQFRVERRDRGMRARDGLRRFLETLLAEPRRIRLRRLRHRLQRGGARTAIALEILRRGGAGAMHRGLAAGAALQRIARRRLQPGRGTHAGLAAVDRGVQQFGQRRADRLDLGAPRAGLRRRGFRALDGGLLGCLGSFRHTGNMGRVPRR